jgi:hypothetical protein
VILNLRAVASAKRAVVSLASAFFLASLTTSATPSALSSDVREQVEQHEFGGDLAGARSLLEKDAATDSGAAQALAEFLCNHGDSGCRAAYVKWSGMETSRGQKKTPLRNIVLTDFLSGDSADLAADLKRYNDAGGLDLALPPARSPLSGWATVSLPGPLASFARMAALSPDVAPEDLLPALARNIVTNGYEAAGNETLQPTEYLRLLTRYIGQARELQAMAGTGRQIVIPACDSDQTGALLKILGYRMRGSCGTDIVLETVNPTKAFLTVDSGFPLTTLEQDLRANHRFELPYAPTSVPVLYSADYWLSALGKQTSTDFLDGFLSDAQLCRLYLGLSHLDRDTAEALRKQASAQKLRVYSHVLDFYGGMFQIRNGSAVVPGSPKAWASLVGASPSNPGAFFDRLISVDDGWLASYFDALSRIEGPTFTYLTQPERLKRFYDALRGKVTTPGPARPVFRSSTELMLLTTSLLIEPNGRPHIPGNLDIWRNLFIKHPHGKYDGKLTRAASSWRSDDDLIEALFGLSRKSVENEPLRIFLALNDIDRHRSRTISPQLAGLLVNNYRALGAQYLLFAEFPSLSEASMQGYIELSDDIMHVRDAMVRSDMLGSVQSLVELWRILCREGSIPVTQQDAVFARVVKPFAGVKQETEIFDADRNGVDALLAVATPKTAGTRQEQLLTLLVGKLHEGSSLSRADYFARIFDAQRLVNIDNLITVADKTEKGQADAKALKNISDQLKRLAETEPTRGSLSAEEKSSLAVGYWSDRHVDLERKLNVETLLKGPEKKDPRALLAPLMRDSLVGLIYCYYAPPGAQLLLTNPLLVRSHDFIGPEGTPSEWRNTEVSGSGWPESAGGRLTGSLINLPYALAEAEQNFLSPKREQALIWADLVPQMIADVTINRWRDVSPDQLRWVALNIRRGKMLLSEAAMNFELRPRVLDALGRYLPPNRVAWLAANMQVEDFEHALLEIPTVDFYAIAVDPALSDVVSSEPSVELARIGAAHKPELSPGAIARAFGTPKPTLTHSFDPSLLYLRTFPALMGFSSRILAESWESNNLFYAALAYQAGVPANVLDNYVPEWNRAAIENIFATHLEDWPALLRSLDTLGIAVREKGAQAVAMSYSEN